MKWTTHSLCFKVWNFSLFALYHSFAAKAEHKWNWRLCKSYRMLVWCSVHVERLATCPTHSNHNRSQRDSANECVLMCVNVNSIYVEYLCCGIPLTPGRMQLLWAQRRTLVIYKTRLQNIVLYSWGKTNKCWTAVITKSTNSEITQDLYLVLLLAIRLSVLKCSQNWIFSSRYTNLQCQMIFSF